MSSGTISSTLLDRNRRFVDKVVIVTGSSSGIGRETAIEFAREGASVVLHGQNTERLAQVEGELQEVVGIGTADNKILVVSGSMEDSATPAKIIQATVEKFHRIDVLVNNAGAGTKPGCKDPSSVELLDFLYAVNYRSVVEMCQLALPHLAKTGGNIVNVSSIAALRSSGDFVFYGSVKAALDMYTKGRAQTFGAQGVRINGINPGPVETPIFGRFLPDDVDPVTAAKFLEILKKMAADNTVMGRMGRSSEMASVIKFLASDEASYMTGACVVADGGSVVFQPEWFKEANTLLQAAAGGTSNKE